MRTCKEVSILISESLDRRLPLWQRVSLWMHVSLCRFCRRFRKDLLHIHQQFQQDKDMYEDEMDMSNERLTDQVRDRIKSLLESQT